LVDRGPQQTCGTGPTPQQTNLTASPARSSQVPSDCAYEQSRDPLRTSGRLKDRPRAEFEHHRDAVAQAGTQKPAWRSWWGQQDRRFLSSSAWQPPPYAGSLTQRDIRVSNTLEVCQITRESRAMAPSMLHAQSHAGIITCAQTMRPATNTPPRHNCCRAASRATTA